MSKRIDVLDVLRGVAILGTLGTNIWLIADPAGPAAILSMQRSGTVEIGLRWLTNGKFLGMLTVLFGVGLELQYRSARQRGARWPGWYLWRAALLFLEGLLHYLLVFEFDVLMSYAVISVIVAFLIGRGDRTVWRWLVGAGAVHLALVALLTLGPGSGGSPGPDLFARGSYGQQVLARVESAGLYRAEAVFIIPMGIALFLLGSRLLRAGAFAPDPHGAGIRRRLMLAGLGAGVPINLLPSYAGPRWFMVARSVCAPLVTFGLIGLVTTIVHALPAGPGSSAGR